MLHNASMRAIEKRENETILEHISRICQNRDADALQNWRGYYKNQLMYFDEKAQKIILKNSDCIVSKESEEIIKERINNTKLQNNIVKKLGVNGISKNQKFPREFGEK